jgi:polyisoprenoid-binding protein YceI
MTMIRKLVALGVLHGLLAGAPVPANAQVPTWNIDPVHSELTFRIRHFVTKVPGTFLDWSGVIRADPARLAEGTVEVTIRSASVSTRNEKRDADLRSTSFFDVATYPAITFRSTKVDVAGSAIAIQGDLTIRGVTRSVTLEGEYTGVTGSMPGARIGFSASTRINRLDFGVSWNRAVEGGGLMLGDEVTIDIAIEAVQK